MVFIFDHENNMFLKSISGYWGGFIFPTNGGVDIGEMTIQIINKKIGANLQNPNSDSMG